MGYVLQRLLCGRAYGDFRPAHQSREELLAKIERVRTTYDLTFSISALVVDFTSRVVWMDEDRDDWGQGFFRTRQKADGGVLNGSNAIAIFNGDCPTVTLWDPQTARFAHLHAGYRCLIRQDPSEWNILEAAIGEFEDRRRVRACIWGGIGPCCWVPEYDDKPEILEPARAGRNSEFLARSVSRTTRSPLGPGQVSVDLYKLARLFLLRLAVPAQNISGDATCACCATEADRPIYWSHTRWKQEGGTDGRNLAVTWIERLPNE